MRKQMFDFRKQNTCSVLRTLISAIISIHWMWSCHTEIVWCAFKYCKNAKAYVICGKWSKKLPVPLRLTFKGFLSKLTIFFRKFVVNYSKMFFVLSFTGNIVKPPIEFELRTKVVFFTLVSQGFALFEFFLIATKSKTVVLNIRCFVVGCGK